MTRAEIIENIAASTPEGVIAVIVQDTMGFSARFFKVGDTYTLQVDDSDADMPASCDAPVIFLGNGREVADPNTGNTVQYLRVQYAGQHKYHTFEVNPKHLIGTWEVRRQMRGGNRSMTDEVHLIQGAINHDKWHRLWPALRYTASVPRSMPVPWSSTIQLALSPSEAKAMLAGFDLPDDIDPEEVAGSL